MSKKMIAIASAAAMMFSSCSIPYINPNFEGKIAETQQKQLSLKTPEQGYNEIMDGYIKLKHEEEELLRQQEAQRQEELRIQREKELAMQKEKDEYNRTHVTFDRGSNTTYTRMDVNIYGTWYTNENTALEGGKKDKMGKLLTSHTMKICAVPKNIPYGSLLEYNGEMYLCCDTGTAIRFFEDGTMHVDFFYPNKDSYWIEQNLSIRHGKATLYIKNN